MIECSSAPSSIAKRNFIGRDTGASYDARSMWSREEDSLRLGGRSEHGRKQSSYGADAWSGSTGGVDAEVQEVRVVGGGMPLGWQPREVSMGPQSMTYGLIGECDKFDTTMPRMSAPMLVADVVEHAARILGGDR